MATRLEKLILSGKSDPEGAQTFVANICCTLEQKKKLENNLGGQKGGSSTLLDIGKILPNLKTWFLVPDGF